MKSWIRIILVIFVLIGGTAFFGYWSVDQFSQVFDDINTSYIANTYSGYKSLSREAIEITQNTSGIPINMGTSTDFGLFSTSTSTVISTSTPNSTSTTSALSFIFPKSNSKVYIGCTYKIYWVSSSTISSVRAALVDFSTKVAVGYNTSGLVKENVIEEDSDNLNWKVGTVSPGTYYIKISKINNVDAEIRSKVFTINKIPANTSISKQKNICRDSDGLL